MLTYCLADNFEAKQASVVCLHSCH